MGKYGPCGLCTPVSTILRFRIKQGVIILKSLNPMLGFQHLMNNSLHTLCDRVGRYPDLSFVEKLWESSSFLFG